MKKYIGIPILIYLIIYISIQYWSFPKKLKFAAKKNQHILVYIDSFSQSAKEEMRRSAVPASIKLAQGILESQHGKSELAKKACNHFGIKCGKNWDGLRYSVVSNEWEVEKKRMIPRLGCFRAYDSVSDCYRAHSDFLRNGDRYKALFNIMPGDYRSWAYGLQKAGYATDPKYAEKLISLIERFQLYKYDSAFPIPTIIY